MKICLYQGTFNPIHNAHIEVAKFVYDNFDYEKILFIPAFKPPHKANGEKNGILAQHRLNMVKLATGSYPNFTASDIEYQRNEVSYTYYTVKELYEKCYLSEKPGFIIGTDAFLAIENWCNSDKLKELIDFVLFIRESNFDETPFIELQKKGYNYSLTKMNFIDISSSEVRSKVKQNIEIYDIVPKEVARYIKENELYRN